MDMAPGHQWHACEEKGKSLSVFAHAFSGQGLVGDTVPCLETLVPVGEWVIQGHWGSRLKLLSPECSELSPMQSCPM